MTDSVAVWKQAWFLQEPQACMRVRYIRRRSRRKVEYKQETGMKLPSTEYPLWEGSRERGEVGIP